MGSEGYCQSEVYSSNGKERIYELNLLYTDVSEVEGVDVDVMRRHSNGTYEKIRELEKMDLMVHPGETIYLIGEGRCRVTIQQFC